MKRKKLIILIVILLLSGCNAEYNAVIKSDNSVSENLKLIIPNNLFDNDPKEEIDNNIKVYRTIDNYKNYKYKGKVTKDFSYVEIKKKYDDLNSYITSPFIEGLFQNVTIIENKEFNIFKTVGEYYHDYLYGKETEGVPNVRPKNSMNDVIVTIKLHNRIIETNADIKDEKNNVYTWNFNYENRKKGIYIKYSNEKRYDVIAKSFIIDNLISIALIGGLSLSIISIFVIGYIRNSSSNKI